MNFPWLSLLILPLKLCKSIEVMQFHLKKPATVKMRSHNTRLLGFREPMPPTGREQCRRMKPSPTQLLQNKLYLKFQNLLKNQEKKRIENPAVNDLFWTIKFMVPAAVIITCHKRSVAEVREKLSVLTYNFEVEKKGSRALFIATRGQIGTPNTRTYKRLDSNDFSLTKLVAVEDNLYIIGAHVVRSVDQFSKMILDMQNLANTHSFYDMILAVQVDFLNGNSKVRHLAREKGFSEVGDLGGDIEERHEGSLLFVSNEMLDRFDLAMKYPKGKFAERPVLMYLARESERHDFFFHLNAFVQRPTKPFRNEELLAMAKTIFIPSYDVIVPKPTISWFDGDPSDKLLNVDTVNFEDGFSSISLNAEHVSYHSYTHGELNITIESSHIGIQDKQRNRLDFILRVDQLDISSNSLLPGIVLMMRDGRLKPEYCVPDESDKIFHVDSDTILYVIPLASFEAIIVHESTNSQDSTNIVASWAHAANEVIQNPMILTAQLSF